MKCHLFGPLPSHVATVSPLFVCVGWLLRISLVLSHCCVQCLREQPEGVRFVLLMASVRHGGRVWWRNSHLDRQEQSRALTGAGHDKIWFSRTCPWWLTSPARLYCLQLHHLPITNSYLASISGLDHSFSQSPGGLIIFINALIDTPRNILS